MSKNKNYRLRISPDQPGNPEPRPHYRKAMEILVNAGVLDTTPGLVTVIDIQHDDWCKFWEGGICNCNPNIIQRPAKPGEVTKD